MNFHKIVGLLPDNPLCGIDTYKDTLNLADGSCTRQIKKLVLDNTTVFGKGGSDDSAYFVINLGDSTGTLCVCSHFVYTHIASDNTDIGTSITASSKNLRIRPENVADTTAEQFNQWITEQYNAGTPVIVWYVLATPTTETITVPTGLSGTEEGYLNQSGTPTKTNPIYPTANTVGYWTDIPYYIRKTATDNITSLPTTIYGDGTNMTVTVNGRTVINLLDTSIIENGYNILGNGAISADSRRIATTQAVDVTTQNSVTLSYIYQGDTINFISALFNNDTLVRRDSGGVSGDSIDVSGGNKLYLCWYCGSKKITKADLKDIILSSTPSPSSPVPVTGVGDVVVNLWGSETTINKTDAISYYSYNLPTPLPVGTYTISCHVDADDGVKSCRCSFRDSSGSGNVKTVQLSANDSRTSVTFEITEPVYKVYLYGDSTTSVRTAADFIDIMLNSGSEALLFDSIGKLEVIIESNDEKRHLILDRTQSTRRIKKLVFDGTEEWALNTTALPPNKYFSITNNEALSGVMPICTHYTGSNSADWRNIPLNAITVSLYSSSNLRTVINTGETYSTIEDFKTYLAQQYTAGTPVTVWYVLETETTGIVNEPLMKIDDYADSISASIPTTDGANTINVPTALQPSSVDVNYHGWHPMSSIHTYKYSTNLIDCAVEEGGYSSSTGNKSTSDTVYRVSDHIAVEPNTSYVFGVNGSSFALQLFEYTKNKNFIGSSVVSQNNYFTTGENTYFITFSRNKSSGADYWQLNKGQTILPYEAYYEPYWE